MEYKSPNDKGIFEREQVAANCNVPTAGKCAAQRTQCITNVFADANCNNTAMRPLAKLLWTLVSTSDNIIINMFIRRYRIVIRTRCRLALSRRWLRMAQQG